ncbi:MAG TPA: DUF4287 domain-containing protein [Candidatus Limnocylindria bacterium]|jgi:hypothetical protein|nr:DUF4287 domain-containing protein [Candidatus Limnocylindria bacterium]
MATLDDATRTQIANIERSTGRSLDEWIALVRASGLEKHGQMVAMLKAKHGLGHGNANLIALRARAGADAPVDDEALIASHYEGTRAALRPLYDAVIAAVRRFGPDVELAPKKTYVSLRRRRQFGQVGPSGSNRLEIGLNLDLPVGGRVEKASGMAARRVRITRADELDEQLLGWLRTAYEDAG